MEPWWTVDLRMQYKVHRVILFNRIDCCSENLVNAEVRIGHNGENFLENSVCGSHVTAEQTEKPSVVITCNPPIRGQYVSVQLIGKEGVLTLCEVEVYAANKALASFILTPYAALPGHNNLQLMEKTAEQCAMSCLQETSFMCHSFDYKREDNICWLSDKHSFEVPLKTDYNDDPYDFYERRMEVENCYYDNGESYRGNVAVTIEGDICANWNIMSSITAINPSSYPNAGLGDHNYCRNPDSDQKPWCYFADPDDSELLGGWKHCDILQCESEKTTTEQPVQPITP
ncbi:plasminogen-like, partial [Saccoglossus kowalevskii]|uniref:Plasminogen-like n=1 Tax=Saccoglossus kowalevskii TaxID=10224 RepID=A0ABM0MHN1_SACKO